MRVLVAGKKVCARGEQPNAANDRLSDEARMSQPCGAVNRLNGMEGVDRLEADDEEKGRALKYHLSTRPCWFLCERGALVCRGGVVVDGWFFLFGEGDALVVNLGCAVAVVAVLLRLACFVDVGQPGAGGYALAAGDFEEAFL